MEHECTLRLQASPCLYTHNIAIWQAYTSNFYRKYYAFNSYNACHA